MRTLVFHKYDASVSEIYEYFTFVCLLIVVNIIVGLIPSLYQTSCLRLTCAQSNYKIVLIQCLSIHGPHILSATIIQIVICLNKLLFS